MCFPKPKVVASSTQTEQATVKSCDALLVTTQLMIKEEGQTYISYDHAPIIHSQISCFNSLAEPARGKDPWKGEAYAGYREESRAIIVHGSCSYQYLYV